MLKFICYPFAAIHLMFALSVANPDFKAGAFQQEKGIANPSVVTNISSIYDQWNLQASGLTKEAFSYAMKGYNFLSEKKLLSKTNIITIVDFSKPSSEKRLFVLDILSGRILFNTLVAHGHNSGAGYANKFSNSTNSHESSLGFYVTSDTYFGGNGYSLRLKGCEKGFNDNAYKRQIVLHGSDYVSENFIQQRGFLGRSYGCPAVPLEFSKEIIDCIKNGSCLFLYHPTKKYLTSSKILNSRLS
ncbi:murein L,D-transpeptidase catalytic domain family protein [Ferruginibacter albus]|uniref:murein L,D-transpeptidase catalytic domain family protein n=1 Tax=Ferruginibacter albus TaxID=2875540 RepID=UPI001CC6CBAC|nr:murein L,D-transpeptidase catalytic domain family protein [Ferruginibacter albus]UAY51958.1 murein L,D-transpeptidase catalytic domain family protein [Ferruginibacter albus]